MGLERLFGDRQAYDLAIGEAAKRSRTAGTILEFLETRPYDVVVLNRGENYGQMLTEQDTSGDQAMLARTKYKEAFGEDQIARPTVLWNPGYEFEYYGEVKGVRLDPTGQIYAATLGELKRDGSEYVYKYRTKGQFARAAAVPVVRATKGMMPAWLVLMHELGHVKQFYEGDGDDAWAKRLSDVAGIEAENLASHEIPICKDLGIPPREHYKHMRHGFEAIESTYRLDSKRPALRIADSGAARLEEESWLFWTAKASARTNATEGFFIHPA